MPSFDPIDYAIPAFALLVLGEMIWAWRRRPAAYEPRDTLVSLSFGLGSSAIGVVTAGVVSALFYAAYQLRLFDIGWQWWAWVLCFVLDDLAYYLFHRAAHRIRWFWASHVNHHSSQHYNLSTALRQSWTGFVTLSFLFRLPLVLIGFHPAMVVFCGAINLIYQFWIHTEAIGRMPRWFEAVMNTPSHHRVHHATNPLYLDRNYAGTFIIWDKMFGTFQPERDDIPVDYGLVRQLGSFNLLWAVFHEWAAMAKDVWRAPWRHKLSYVWREPGWSHDGSRRTSSMLLSTWRERHSQTDAERASSDSAANKKDAAQQAAPDPPGGDPSGETGMTERAAS